MQGYRYLVAIAHGGRGDRQRGWGEGVRFWYDAVQMRIPRVDKLGGLFLCVCSLAYDSTYDLIYLFMPPPNDYTLSHSGRISRVGNLGYQLMP